jgi:hypothetical protein
MRTAGGDPPVLEHDDEIRIAHRADPLSDHERGPAMH